MINSPPVRGGRVASDLNVVTDAVQFGKGFPHVCRNGGER